MIGKNMWKIFEATGNVEAYLYVLQYNQMEGRKNEARKQLEALLPSEKKANSL